MLPLQTVTPQIPSAAQPSLKPGAKSWAGHREKPWDGTRMGYWASGAAGLCWKPRTGITGGDGGSQVRTGGHRWRQGVTGMDRAPSCPWGCRGSRAGSGEPSVGPAHSGSILTQNIFQLVFMSPCLSWQHCCTPTGASLWCFFSLYDQNLPRAKIILCRKCWAICGRELDFLICMATPKAGWWAPLPVTHCPRMPGWNFKKPFFFFNMKIKELVLHLARWCLGWSVVKRTESLEIFSNLKDSGILIPAPCHGIILSFVSSHTARPVIPADHWKAATPLAIVLLLLFISDLLLYWRGKQFCRAADTGLAIEFLAAWGWCVMRGSPDVKDAFDILCYLSGRFRLFLGKWRTKICTMTPLTPWQLHSSSFQDHCGKLVR